MMSKAFCRCGHFGDTGISAALCWCNCSVASIPKPALLRGQFYYRGKIYTFSPHVISQNLHDLSNKVHKHLGIPPFRRLFSVYNLNFPITVDILLSSESIFSLFLFSTDFSPQGLIYSFAFLLYMTLGFGSSM